MRICQLFQCTTFCKEDWWGADAKRIYRGLKFSFNDDVADHDEIDDGGQIYDDDENDDDYQNDHDDLLLKRK